VRRLAGGQRLVPMLKFRLVHPPMLIDLNRIGELAGIAIGAGGATIGAMTRQADTESQKELSRGWPQTAEALRHVGHVEPRNRGTIGGSLAQNDPAAELSAVMLALDATITMQRANPTRKFAAERFLISALI
jgi:CO/xanthine dehydrogenase FAD-binding subunit